MNADLELLWRMAGARTGPAVAIDQRPEAVRLAADDRDHQRQPEGAGANERAGRAADTKPNRQRLLQRTRVNSLPGKRSAMLARPVDMRVLADVQKQIELFGEKRIVVLEFQAEERKRFDERAAPDNHLRSPFRKKIERRKLLEHANGIGRAQ